MSDGWGDASGIEGNYEDTDNEEDTNETSETNDTSERTETAETNASAGTSETNSPAEANETNGASETGGTNETNETTEAPGLNETTETKETAGTKANIKDEWNGRTIYIPDDILYNLEDTYLESQLKLRRTGQDEFKKNRHFYPLLVQFGLEALADAEVEEIQARLSDIHDQ